MLLLGFVLVAVVVLGEGVVCLCFVVVVVVFALFSSFVCCCCSWFWFCCCLVWVFFFILGGGSIFVFICITKKYFCMESLFKICDRKCSALNFWWCLLSLMLLFLFLFFLHF